MEGPIDRRVTADVELVGNLGQNVAPFTATDVAVFEGGVLCTPPDEPRTWYPAHRIIAVRFPTEDPF